MSSLIDSLHIRCIIGTMHKFLTLTLSIFCISFAKADEAQSAHVTHTYKTVGESELKLHVFNPSDHKASDQRPAIVFFFGGGWNGGTPEQFFPQCEYLAKRGMVAISAEYRTKKHHGTSPLECANDGKSAIRWVRSNAQTLGIDSSKILAGGGSAGGQVAATIANCLQINDDADDLTISPRVAALVLFNPVFDNGPNGYGYDRVKDYWEKFSPMHNISDYSVPTLVMLGSKDHLIPVTTAEDYKKRMEAFGKRCDLHLYENQTHGFFNPKNPEFYKKTVADMDQFLVSLRFLTAQ